MYIHVQVMNQSTSNRENKTSFLSLQFPNQGPIHHYKQTLALHLSMAQDSNSSPISHDPGDTSRTRHVNDLLMPTEEDVHTRSSLVVGRGSTAHLAEASALRC